MSRVLTSFFALIVAVVASFVLLASSSSSLFVLAAAPSDPFKLQPLPLYGPFFSNNYAGELNVTVFGKSFTSFFWFAEQENIEDPTKGTLTRFLTGGPGCSSLLFFLTEGGPYQMRAGNQFVANEWRWTKFSSLLVFDSPAGIGYSTTSDPSLVWNDKLTAEYNYQAMLAFYKIFPQFRETELIITGESYSGRYVPTLVDQILTGPDATMKNVLTGFAVGNPCTGFIGCQNADPTLEVFLKGQGFQAVAENVITDPTANYDPYDLLVPTCDNDQVYELTKRFESSHPVVKAYGRRKRAMKVGSADGSVPPYGPCSMDNVQTWLNRADVKQMIHAPANVQYLPCSNEIPYDITNTSMVPLYQKFVKETKLNIMIYSGTADSIVNHMQTQTIVHSMGFPLARKEFIAWNYPYVANTSQSQLGGFYLEYEGLSWASVGDSGHMVPQYNPPRAYELMYSFFTTGKPGRM
jgi:serine carboxypeptidase-like clade 2